MLKPMWALTAQSRVAAPRAPLWDMKAIFPGSGWDDKKEELSPTWGRMTPTQFGPTILIPYFF
ncbi:MAG: hypothetical protein A4E58_02047 [Syntrophorhabdus sp. PtaB.Bin006]|nr:MAG: hypothetical protein A4E58_02047 [Syntrophorhabdus sp. PtaB.Bin006]